MQKITAEAMPLYAVPEDEAKKFIDWAWKLREKNVIDLAVMTYPRTIMCSAKNEDETLMFLPLQPVLMYESLAPKPGLTERETALCLWRIGELMDGVMKNTGHCEAYFLTTDDRMAQVCGAHGWEEVSKTFHVMKRKIDPPQYPIEATKDNQDGK